MPILNHSIIPSDTVHNIGVIFNSDFNVRKHISLTRRSCFYNIRDRRRIRSYISLSVAIPIAIALITNMLGYCNSHLYNNASKDIQKRQCVHNCLARVVIRLTRFSHSLPLVNSLHWLPFQSRLIFKLCTIAYQILSSGEPSYLFSILSSSFHFRIICWFNLDCTLTMRWSNQCIRCFTELDSF